LICEERVPLFCLLFFPIVCFRSSRVRSKRQGKKKEKEASIRVSIPAVNSLSQCNQSINQLLCICQPTPKRSNGVKKLSLAQGDFSLMLDVVGVNASLGELSRVSFHPFTGDVAGQKHEHTPVSSFS
jgi:hypothetical protein